MKFKVGDKVKVKKGLKVGTNYGEWCFVKEMREETKNLKFMTIKDVDYDNSYRLKEVDFAWTDEMLEKYEEESNTQVIDLKEVVGAIKDLTSKIDKRTMYDETISDKIIDKASKVPVEELSKKIMDKLDKYIVDKYGALPTKIEIKDEVKSKQITGIFHNKFEDILKIVSKGVPLMLVGSAGAGKNHTLEQVAEALDLDFYFSNAITQEYKLTGFIDANGVYQETQFYKAFKNGGLFFLDEIDASCPESLIILNSAIANGYFDFPNGKVTANENFRVVCAGNTYGTGADMIYVGRNALDGATLDRFTVIEFNYDENVEKSLAYDNELYEFIRDLRSIIEKNSLRYIVSMRATINATKLLQIGMTKANILRSAIIKNMQIDDLNIIINKLKEINNSEWTKELEKIANDRNKN